MRVKASWTRGLRRGLALTAAVLALSLCGCLDVIFGPRGPAPPSRRPISIPVAQPPARVEPGIGLFVEVTRDGLTVGSPMATLGPPDGGDGPSLPCHNPGCPTVESYDFVGFAELLATIKLEYPDQRQLLVRADEGVDYEVIVRILDAARSRGDQELFPEVAIEVALPGSLTPPPAAGSSDGR